MHIEVFYYIFFSISFVSKFVSCDDYIDFLLTTATSRQSTSPKPTTIYRRINVDVNNYESSTFNNLLDFLNYMEARKKGDNSWPIKQIGDWYTWCHLQPKRGNCTVNVHKYYYDADLDECKSFINNDCLGNRNRFHTIEGCERHCKGAAYMKIKHLSEQQLCTLQPNKGMCLALMPRYYFNINEKRCKIFYYGGCGGNLNNFETKAKCMELCGEVN